MLVVIVGILAGCGQHERTSDHLGDLALRPEHHERAHAAIEQIRSGRVLLGIAQLRDLESGQPGSGRSSEWLPSALEALLGQGEMARAESLLAIVGPPAGRPPELRYWTAQVAMAQGDHAAARGNFEAAFEDPVWGLSALFEVAMLESASNRHGEAITLCRRVLARETHHEGARLLLASSQLEAGEIDAALRSAQAINSESARTSLFAHAHLMAGRPAIAIEVLEASPGFRGPLRDYLEGWARLEVGDAAAAIGLLEGLIEPDGQAYKDSRLLLARAFRSAGDEAAAVRLEGIEAEVAQAALARRLQADGTRAAQRGDAREGERLLREATALRPGDGTILNDLAAVLTRLERYAEAEAAFLRASELRPEDASIAANLAQLYTIMGEPGKAIAQEQRYRALRRD
jgi:tetratricopeptide (TPR) repeat protein